MDIFSLIPRAAFSDMKKSSFKFPKHAGRWWQAPLIPTRRRLRLADLCKIKASLVYRVSSRTARATQRNPALKKRERERERRKEGRKEGRKGKERKGKERKGKERKGKERKGKERREKKGRY
jgi:hypothetical protein